MRVLRPLLLSLLLASPAGAHDSRTPPRALSTVEDRLALGDELRHAGQPEAARAEYEAVLRQAPGLLDALRSLASLEAQTGRNRRALELWDRILEHRPGDDRARAGRGRALLALGRHEEAAAQLLVLLEKRDRWHPELVADRARALQLAGHLRPARAQLQAGIERLGAVPILVRQLRRLEETSSP